MAPTALLLLLLLGTTQVQAALVMLLPRTQLGCLPAHQNGRRLLLHPPAASAPHMQQQMAAPCVALLVMLLRRCRCIWHMQQRLT